MKRSIILLLTALLTVMVGNANSISINDIIINAGSTKTIQLTMPKNDKGVSGFQFDVEVPDGMILIKNGDHLFTSNIGDFEVNERLQSDGSYRVMAYSPSLSTISLKGTEVVTMMLKADKKAKASILSLRVKNVVLSDAYGEVTKLPDTKGNITIAEPVKVVAKDKSSVYGDNYGDLQYDLISCYTSGTPTIRCEATITSPVGNYDIIVEKGSLETDTVTLVDGILTISKAPLMVTAKSYTREEGEANPTFEIAYSGWKNNETEAVLIKKPTATTTANTQSAPGTYPIIVSGGEATNYDFTYVNGTLTITGTIPPTTYTLSVFANGNGSVSYDGNTIRNRTSTFTVNEGYNAVIVFLPDNGYRIKSVIVNGSNVTSSISNSQYTISNIRSNTIVEVDFEAIPVTTYTLSIKATGNGSASFNGTTIRSKTSTFTVNEGTSATITFVPDNGYRIKSFKENGVNMTSSVLSGQYTIYNINSNTTIEVEFEVIPTTSYNLSITASGNGLIICPNNIVVKNETKVFRFEDGGEFNFQVISDEGYSYTLSTTASEAGGGSSGAGDNWKIYGIKKDASVTVSFIERQKCDLKITSTGNGSVSYDGNTIRNKASTFTVYKGSSASIIFSPDNGNRIKSVLVNSSNVTSSVTNNNNYYYINNITKSTTVEVEFVEELKSFANNGVNYSVMSYNDRTVYVSNGSYGSVLEVPAKISYQDIEWTVAGIDNGALTNNPDLAAIIWNPTANFTVSVGNPNLLLYVKSASYAPTTIKNVIVNNVADNITLADAASGNNFYCPQEFTAKSISYTHNYGMITGIGESRGWETIALPFDVQKITHSSKGEIVPFTNWKSGDSKKPFWLMELGTSGFVDASAIKANTPYIISMPNHTNYKNEFRLNGNITFSAENVKVKASNNLQSTSSGDKTFHPNYVVLENTNAYALNVNNDYVSYSGGSKEGSTFVLNLRKVHPFEAYMTSTSKARQTITIQDNLTTEIREVAEIWDDKILRVYNLSGQLLMVEENKSLDEIKQLLSAGVYIINGKKIIIK